MNTLFFKYAVEVEKTHSITKAADNLYMAQPNLSKAIKELEESLGFEIFQRTPRGVTPTKQGREFLVYAKNIIGQIRKIDHLSHSIANTSQRFSVSLPMGGYSLKAFGNFAAKLDADRDIDIIMRETSPVKAISDVLDGECKIALIRYPLVYEKYFLDYLAEKKLGHEAVWQYSPVVIVNENSKLAEKEYLEDSDFQNMIEITESDNIVPYLSYNETQNSAKRKISVCEHGSSIDLLADIKDSYIIGSPLPEEVCARYSVVQRAFHSHKRELCDVLIYQEGYVFSELDKKFIDCLFSAKNEVAFKTYQ